MEYTSNELIRTIYIDYDEMKEVIYALVGSKKTLVPIIISSQAIPILYALQIPTNLRDDGKCCI